MLKQLSLKMFIFPSYYKASITEKKNEKKKGEENKESGFQLIYEVYVINIIF